VVDADGHWEWRGARSPKGYGSVDIDGVRWQTHRYAYTTMVAAIPEGYEIDHLCGNTSCCNPQHLEAVTPEEHWKRSDQGRYNRMKDHCPKGHPYDSINTILKTSGGRGCRECETARLMARSQPKQACDA
jgi:hypothetical protein